MRISDLPHEDGPHLGDDRQSELRRQLERLAGKRIRLEQFSRRYSWGRLGIALAGMGVSLYVYYTHRTWLGETLLLFFAVFIGSVFFHRRVLHSL